MGQNTAVNARLTSPAHRGVVQRHTSPGRSEGCVRQNRRRGSRGQTELTPHPNPRAWVDSESSDWF